MNMRSWSRKTLAIVGLAIAVVFFLSVDVVSNAMFPATQVDLTQGRIYTLSKSTHKVLGDIKEPITLRLFVSNALVTETPNYATYASRVKEMLERYVSLSHGKITLQYVNPEPFSPAEDRAVGYGLQAVPLDQNGEVVYFGLVGTNTTDDTDTIPFLALQREKFLEYDLTRMIVNLAHPKKKVVGIVTGSYMESDPLKKWKPWRITELIKQSYDIKSIYDVDQWPSDMDVLLVAHPIGLKDEMLYKIDQYVMHGGKALVFVDPFSEEVTRANQAQRMPPDMGSDFNKEFKAWGIQFDPKKFVGDREAATRVAAGEDAGGRPIITDYLAWLGLKGDDIKRGDPITDELKLINVAAAGAISAAPGAKIKLEPLLETSKDSELIDADKVRVDPKPAELMKGFKSQNKSYIIAARVTGEVKSAFPGGPPHDKDKDKDKGADAKADKDAKGAAAKPAGYGFSRGVEGTGGPHRRRRHGHPGRPVLAAQPGFLRPEPGSADRQQRRLRAQRDRQPVRRLGAFGPALARRGGPPVHPGREHPEGRRGPLPREGAAALRPARRTAEEAEGAADQEPGRRDRARGRGYAGRRQGGRRDDPVGRAGEGDRGLPAPDDRNARRAARRAAPAAPARRDARRDAQGRQCRRGAGAGADRGHRAGAGAPRQDAPAPASARRLSAREVEP